LGEILLSRVSADRVLPAFNEILSKYPDPCSLGKGNKKELEKILTPLRLQKKKAALIVSVAKLFCCYREDTSKLLRYLNKLKGMEKYTYNAIILFGFEKKVVLVDGVIGRIFGIVFGEK